MTRFLVMDGDGVPLGFREADSCAQALADWLTEHGEPTTADEILDGIDAGPGAVDRFDPIATHGFICEAVWQTDGDTPDHELWPG